jgi:dTDP-4-dehydrorhamnose 3,5-epimerase
MLLEGDLDIAAAAIPDVKILTPKIFGDDRGHLYESWNAHSLAKLGLEANFVQDNHSRSARGVLRGLHYQLRQPQGKLVRVVAGSAFDVAVDLRRGSPSFGRWAGMELSAANKKQCWIPPGFAHGFLCLEEGTELLYKCTDFYTPEWERAIAWNDPELAIAWPLDGRPLLSPKDASAPLLARAELPA